MRTKLNFQNITTRGKEGDNLAVLPDSRLLVKDFRILWLTAYIWDLEINDLRLIQYLDIIEHSTQCLPPFEDYSLEVLVTDEILIFKELFLLHEVIEFFENLEIRLLDTALDLR